MKKKIMRFLFRFSYDTRQHATSGMFNQKAALQISIRASCVQVLKGISKFNQMLYRQIFSDNFRGMRCSMQKLLGQSSVEA